MYRAKLLRKGQAIQKALFGGVPTSVLCSAQSHAHNYCTSGRRKLEGGDASTVVIGGGVVGCSIAFHLAKQGEKDVMLLEKSELTAGSTWHAAGLTTSYHPAVNVKKIHYNSLNMYAKLEAETGQEVGFHQPGSIRVATTPKHEEEFKFQMAKAGVQKAPQILLSPKEIKKKVPLIQEDKVVKGLYTPLDGHIDPYSLTQAIAKGARKYGAKIEQGTPVSSLNLREDGRWEVGTTKGNILADRVVNAAGFWAKEVGKLADLDLPLVPLEHQYLVTSSVPEIQSLKEEFPVLRFMEASCYVRQERDGFLVGPYESPETMKLRDDWSRDQVPPDFGKELFPSDLDRMMPHLESVMEVIPSFASANITSIVNGPITYTPDVLPLVGPSVVPNMWLAVGFGYGIVHGGGIGKFVADWIQRGEPPHDLMEMDPGRFGAWTSEDFVLSKARESYGMNNAPTFPHEQRFAGRPTKRLSAAYNKQVERGAFMVIDAGWEHPGWFAKEGETPQYKPSFWRTNWNEAVEREWNGVKTSAGVIDLTPFGKIILHGPQAAPFIDYVTANRVPEVGKCVVTHMLTSTGRVCSELTITRTDQDRFFLVTGSGSEIHDLRWIKEIIRKEGWKVECNNVSEEKGCLSVAGPSSRQLLSYLHPRFKDRFPFFTLNKVNVGGIEIDALRLTYTGELGWELYHPRNESQKLYEMILDAGTKIDGGLVDFGSYTLNVFRSEKGFRLWGKEMNHDTTIVEARLMGFVDLTKKDFIGKSWVEKRLREGSDRELVQIKIDPNCGSDPQGDESIWKDGKVIGNTTSGCFSFKLNQPLAFAYLPPFATHPGVKVEVELMGERHEAEVLAKPPDHIYKEKKK